MKNIAIVLAAGRGNRLRPLTDTVPKCMVSSPEGVPLLHRAITKLHEVGVSDLILGVGFQKESVTVPGMPGLTVHRVTNDDWDKTNNIYTLALCIDYLKDSQIDFDNIFLIEGDICLGSMVLPRLLMERDSATAVLPASYTKRGSCVSVDDLGYVRVLSDNRDWNDPGIFKLANIYKLTRSDFLAVGEHLEYHNRSEYYEAIIGKLIGRVRLKAIIDGDCREVDNSYDWFNLMDSANLDYASVRANWGGLWRRSVRDHFFISNPYYPTAFIKDRLRYSLDTLISNYPSGRWRLNEMLKAFCNVDRAFPLYALNGASEGIRALEQYFNAKTAAFHLYFAPAFGEYLRFNLTEGPVADGTIVVSPNNPTAQKIGFVALEHLLATYAYVILDLSLNPEKDTPYLNLMQRFPNLIVVKSLSKLMGIPGIRLGYVAVNDTCVPAFEARLPIWNVNSLAEGFLELHLDSLSDYEGSVDEWGRESARVEEQLRKLISDSDIFPSHTFITVTTDFNLSTPLYEQYGVFVADVSAKFHDGRQHTRIGVRGKNANDYLIYALKDIVGAAAKRVDVSTAALGTALSTT